MTITIDLLRHGDIAGGTKLIGHLDEPLTELGWQQLRAVLDAKTPPWTSIISSPLQRCYAFAKELTDQHDLPLLNDSRFQEIGFGQWEGRLLADLYEGEDADKMIQFWQNPTANPAPDGEAYESFEQRVVSAWEELLNQSCDDTDQHYLLVAHGGVIRVILRHLLDFPTKHFFRIEIPYASLSRVQQNVPNHPRLVFLNSQL
jgi:alpha-ribazole phosphatase/probable phosphoglycerate mutase